jgi:hypothetical protein
MGTYYCTNNTRIGINNMQRRAAGCAGASPAVVEGSSSCSHLCHLWPRSIIIIIASIACGWTNQEPRETRTAAAKSNIALPAMRASSWLSLISTLIMCTTRLNSLPRESRSIHALLSYLVSRRRGLTIADGVKAPFLAGDHNIRHRLAVLPSFWGTLYVSITVKHL